MGEMSRVSGTYASCFRAAKTHDLLCETGGSIRGQAVGCGMRFVELTPFGPSDPVVDGVVDGVVHGVPVRSMAWMTRASFRAAATRATGQPTRAFCVW